MEQAQNLRVLVLSTVESGVDAVSEVLRKGFKIEAILGLHPAKADPVRVSGWIDIEEFASCRGLSYYYCQSYSLTAPEDRALLESLAFDVVWVSGWQRLVPEWLIELSPYGVLGGHGSPDGIHGGRGRSPQNWALMLECPRFDISLFHITPGVADGPVLASRSIYYSAHDDIAVSHHRAALALADLLVEVLSDPAKLTGGVPQPEGAYYFPQRLPEDGWVDWSLSGKAIAAHCRAQTRPYPGIKTAQDEVTIILWYCISFDEIQDADCGTVSSCFINGSFLVNCAEGRVLIRDWEADDSRWKPAPGMKLSSVSFQYQINKIIERHKAKNPDQRVSQRIVKLLECS